MRIENQMYLLSTFLALEKRRRVKHIKSVNTESPIPRPAKVGTVYKAGDGLLCMHWERSDNINFSCPGAQRQKEDVEVTRKQIVFGSSC